MWLQDEIDDAHQMCEQTVADFPPDTPPVQLFSLYSNMSPQKQMEVFEPTLPVCPLSLLPPSHSSLPRLLCVRNVYSDIGSRYARGLAAWQQFFIYFGGELHKEEHTVYFVVFASVSNL